MLAPMRQSKISIITTSYTTDRFKDIIELLDSIQAAGLKSGGFYLELHCRREVDVEEVKWLLWPE
jgi:hypothetical protein